MQYLTNDDLNFLSSQNENKMNMIVFGMTALMDETNERVQQLESQTWFQRMSNTLTGKNKMTVNEIANNRDKVNVYLSEAISCLYDQNKINENMILGLGNRLNELYAQQIELKQMIGAFVTKLNQKIISIDNFHMLTEEINQGVYSANTPILSICKIASQLDGRTIHDSRKMSILVRAMEQNGLLTENEVLFTDFLQELLTVSETDGGIIAMMFENAKDDYVTEIALETVCQYYMLPDKVRKMKNRKSVVEAVLTVNQIDLDYSISTKEYYESLMACLTNNVLIVEAQAEEGKYQQQYEAFFQYLEDAEYFFWFIKDMLLSWKLGEGELYSPNKRNDYCQRLKEMKTFVLGTSMPGKQFYATLANLDAFIQNIVWLLPKENFFECWNSEKETEILHTTEDGLIESEGKYFTISEMVKSRFAAYTNTDNDCFSALTESKIRNSTAEDYENISNLTGIFSDEYLIDCVLTGGETYFSILNNFLEQYIDNPDKGYENFFSLCDKYPIEFETVLYGDMPRDMENQPYISFSYQKSFLDEDECCDANQTSFWLSMTGSDNKKLVISVEFHNMDKLGTIHFSVLENSAYDWDTFTEYEKFKISWGDWIDNRTCQIKFAQLSEEIGKCKVKVWADYDPDIVGIIEGM